MNMAGLSGTQGNHHVSLVGHGPHAHSGLITGGLTGTSVGQNMMISGNTTGLTLGVTDYKMKHNSSNNSI